MSTEELESYRFQLEQVELALQSDSTNEELQKLQADLKELIAMFEQVQSSPVKKSNNADASPTTTTMALKNNTFSVNQEVMARWSGDGQFYKAVITAIGGADQVFSVKFKGYNDSEFVKAEDIKPIIEKKRTGVFEDVKASNKKVKKEAASSSSPSTTSASSNSSKMKKKTVEFENKKNAWLSFATGDKKKHKKAVPVINKKSIFKTPDNPEGKVGVVGSGKGMTSFQQRGKHIYTPSSNTDD
ncbi:uncharacterized protein BX663DRAFT_439089 [Cokeromyces recurvatus]|uniref:uncharacterized protein n=1 Tax=Cokeromyces recurvatus TaxID=90255 RepID=UPI00221FB3BC|nr:uncharacterized protein BX663DRAFT_439089 [Cokeromyces recurvatus]KAI7900545.1 hypothetical protein BX663DRAFT_439089 [Cokeromyces recurvatus]